MARQPNLIPSDGLEAVFSPPGIRIAHQPPGTLLGRTNGGLAGRVGTITLGSGLTMTGSVLSATGGGGGASAYEVGKAVLYGS